MEIPTKHACRSAQQPAGRGAKKRHAAWTAGVVVVVHNHSKARTSLLGERGAVPCRAMACLMTKKGVVASQVGQRVLLCSQGAHAVILVVDSPDIAHTSD
jgi:hypothetical protein